jgi:hypothetical protein
MVKRIEKINNVRVDVLCVYPSSIPPVKRLPISLVSTFAVPVSSDSADPPPLDQQPQSLRNGPDETQVPADLPEAGSCTGHIVCTG